MAIEKITGIVTDVIRYNDRHNIVTLFTRSRGRISFLSSAGGGKSGKIRNSRLQPLSVIEADIKFHENRNLQNLGAVAPACLWKDLYFNPMKGAIVMFLSEFLNRYLRDADPEPQLWDYVLGSLKELEQRKKGLANFHISFLVGFLYFAGISPDIHDYEKGDYFDLVGGRAVAERPMHKSFLYPVEASFLPLLMRMNYSNDRLFRFKAGERRELLRKMLFYYSIHFPGMSTLRSPEVLAEVFS